VAVRDRQQRNSPHHASPSTPTPTQPLPTTHHRRNQVLRPPAPPRQELPQEEVRPLQPAAPQEEAQVWEQKACAAWDQGAPGCCLGAGL